MIGDAVRAGTPVVQFGGRARPEKGGVLVGTTNQYVASNGHDTASIAAIADLDRMFDEIAAESDVEDESPPAAPRSAVTLAALKGQVDEALDAVDVIEGQLLIVRYELGRRIALKRARDQRYRQHKRRVEELRALAAVSDEAADADDETHQEEER